MSPRVSEWVSGPEWTGCREWVGRKGIYDLVRRFICYCWWFILNRNQIEGQTCAEESCWNFSLPVGAGPTTFRSPQNHRAGRVIYCVLDPGPAKRNKQGWPCLWSGRKKVIQIIVDMAIDNMNTQAPSSDGRPSAPSIRPPPPCQLDSMTTHGNGCG